jgi:hypothetical protein
MVASLLALGGPPAAPVAAGEASSPGRAAQRGRTEDSACVHPGPYGARAAAFVNLGCSCNEALPGRVGWAHAERRERTTGREPGRICSRMNDAGGCSPKRQAKDEAAGGTVAVSNMSTRVALAVNDDARIVARTTSRSPFRHAWRCTTRLCAVLPSAAFSWCPRLINWRPHPRHRGGARRGLVSGATRSDPGGSQGRRTPYPGSCSAASTDGRNPRGTARLPHPADR